LAPRIRCVSHSLPCCLHTMRRKVFNSKLTKKLPIFRLMIVQLDRARFNVPVRVSMYWYSHLHSRRYCRFPEHGERSFVLPFDQGSASGVKRLGGIDCLGSAVYLRDGGNLPRLRMRTVSRSRFTDDATDERTASLKQVIGRTVKIEWARALCRQIQRERRLKADLRTHVTLAVPAARPFDRLLFHTDGILEARNAQGPHLGQSRLSQIAAGAFGRRVRHGRSHPSGRREVSPRTANRRHDIDCSRNEVAIRQRSRCEPEKSAPSDRFNEQTKRRDGRYNLDSSRRFMRSRESSDSLTSESVVSCSISTACWCVSS